MLPIAAEDRVEVAAEQRIDELGALLQVELDR